MSEADELIAAIKARVEEERRKKQAATLAATHESGNFGVSVNKLTETNQDERKAAHKTAELFNTNRTNKRRNLTSSQWAAVAVEADEIIAAIRAKVEEERRKKQAATQSGAITQLVEPQPDKNKTTSDTKTAELFNTNRTYVNAPSFRLVGIPATGGN